MCPSPSPEARARDNAKQRLGFSYIKNGKKHYTIHIGNPCSCCWIENTYENSAGNGECDICAKKDHERPCESWTEDMKKFWDKHQYMDRNAFNMETRTLTNRYANI